MPPCVVKGFRAPPKSASSVYLMMRFLSRFIFCFSAEILGILSERCFYMKIGKYLSLFCVGGGAYVGLELLYRGRSHISMFGAGGLCFLLLGRLRKEQLPIPAKVGAGAGMITAVELATG